jgi:ankyrin repeat protein
MAIETPLFAAITDNDLEAAKTIIASAKKSDLKFQMDEKGYEESPFIYAAEIGRLEILRAIVERKIRFSKWILCEALVEACLKGHSPVVIFLLQMDAPINLSMSNYTPLTAAVYGNHLELVKLLVEAGAKVEQRNGGGIFPLSMAGLYGYREIFAYLEPLTLSPTKLKEAREDLQNSDKPRRHPVFQLIDSLTEPEQPDM